MYVVILTHPSNPSVVCSVSCLDVLEQTIYFSRLKPKYDIFCLVARCLATISTQPSRLHICVEERSKKGKG
jgi:hypothetical protein